MIDRNKFCMDIEKFAMENNLDIMDALLHYCENNNLEIETVAKIVNRNPRIMELLELQAKRDRLLKDNTLHATLPI